MVTREFHAKSSDNDGFTWSMPHLKKKIPFSIVMHCHHQSKIQSIRSSILISSPLITTLFFFFYLLYTGRLQSCRFEFNFSNETCKVSQSLLSHIDWTIDNLVISEYATSMREIHKFIGIHIINKKEKLYRLQ